MSIESQIGAKPVAVPDYIPVAQPAPPRPPSATRPPSGPPVPVAQPATPRPKLDGPPEQAEAEDELLPPSAIKGWSTSIAIHALLLLILAFWILTPRARPDKIFDTSLAGSPFGSDLSDQLTGGLGMDEPLALPEAEKTPALETPTITALPPEKVQLDASAIKPSSPAVPKNASGGGVSLTGSGQAGKGDGFGVARFGSGGENINGVDVKVGDPQFTLIWNSRADLDLHVQEPGGSHIYWEERNGNQGGELDVDDVDGFGPENVYWVQGQGPPGEYKWYVHYYGGLGGSSVPTKWKVRLKHNGATEVITGELRYIGQKSETRSFRVGDGPKEEAARRKEAAKAR
jgi:hypothetical protein